MADHNVLGKKGEAIAAEYLEKKGFEILERNWVYNHKEIDLIAKHNNYLVVIEVKTRSTDGWESPKEAITNGKIRFIVEATEAYINEMDIENEVRFDVVTLIPNGEDWTIEHIDEAFHPSL
ncbi:YraN family protein [Carboxylicivirga sp. M1479]|uniref:YraN family protein n=1 Tax=Carboxylicivirga sp. M1479 TaxID=2594476 RepID=UPI00117777FF|nr:YraN family protein [Carboxylicivirga sp. M1479]TRX72397.1 YraN family protein [Carboxylicivirga sp. M1479]